MNRNNQKTSLDEWHEKMMEKEQEQKDKTTPSKENTWRNFAREQDGLS